MLYLGDFLEIGLGKFIISGGGCKLFFLRMKLIILDGLHSRFFAIFFCLVYSLVSIWVVRKRIKKCLPGKRGLMKVN